MAHFAKLMALQLSPGIKQELISPAKIRIVTSRGFPYEAFGPTGMVKPWHVLRFVEMNRSMAYYPLYKSPDEPFLNMVDLFRTCSLFHVSVKLCISKQTYDVSIPKTPLNLETKLVYVGKSSKNVQTDILLPTRGITLATCQIQTVLVDLKTRHAVPFPDWWRAKFARFSSPGGRLQVNVKELPADTSKMERRNEQELNKASKAANSQNDPDANSLIVDVDTGKIESKTEPKLSKTFQKHLDLNAATSCTNTDLCKLENKSEQRLNKTNETSNSQNHLETTTATYHVKLETEKQQDASIPNISKIASRFISQPNFQTENRLIGSDPKITDIAVSSQLDLDTEKHQVESDLNNPDAPITSQPFLQTEKTQDQSAPSDISLKSQLILETTKTPILDTEKTQKRLLPKTFDLAFTSEPNIETESHQVESVPRMTCVEQTVYPSDLDANGHVNWTMFLKYCMDALGTENTTDMSDCHALKSADIAYVGEGSKGQRLKVKFWEDCDVPRALHFHIVDSESDALVNYALLQFYSLTEISHIQSRL